MAGDEREFLVVTTEEGGASYDGVDLEGVARILSSDRQPHTVAKRAVGWAVLAKPGQVYWWPNGVVVCVLKGEAIKPAWPTLALYPNGTDAPRTCEGCNTPIPPVEIHPAIYCTDLCAARDA